jgi:asparagine synthetase B (glutamine-hydrolysing)
MCSIEGFTGPQPFTIEDYTKFNKDRGPDDTNYWSDQFVSFGHNLLAISTNKSKKTQPYVTDKGNVLIYNGEIFGLEDDVFDTEWLVKPLYYLEQGTDLFFSSTPKPLYAVLNKYTSLEIDQKRMQDFQKCDRFMPGSLIPYKDIKKVPPGKILCYNVKERRFGLDDTLWGGAKWNLDMDLKWDPEELEDIINKSFLEVLRPGQSVDKTISLSGGLDSTLIASILKNNNVSATSCSWENKDTDLSTTRQGMFDESVLAEKTCQQFNIKFNKSVVPRDFNHIMNEAYQALGLPIWDRNRIVPRYVNVKQAAENGNKVFIVGDCADELLTGYNGDLMYSIQVMLLQETLMHHILNTGYQENNIN